MSEEQWIRLKAKLRNLDIFVDGGLLLLAGVVLLFIMLGWSHIFLLAWFSSHRILYTGLWILFSIVFLGKVAEEA